MAEQIHGRGLLRSNWDVDDTSDQKKGIPLPDRQKPAPDGAPIVQLPHPEFSRLSDVRLVDAILNRRSRRKFLPDSISIVELSFLLFASQGVQKELRNAALLDQGWNSAVTLFWTAIPYRTEWRYTVRSPKLIALDAGHSCQNLYLACEAIGCGTCAIGAYDQQRCDELLGVDGEDELTVYAAPVGKV